MPAINGMDTEVTRRIGSEDETPKKAWVRKPRTSNPLARVVSARIASPQLTTLATPQITIRTTWPGTASEQRGGSSDSDLATTPRNGLYVAELWRYPCVRLLGLRGTLGSDSRPRINGHAWDSPEALALVKAAAGADAWLEAYDGVDRFDILPLLVATDGAVAAFGRDVRRLRPNIVIGGVDGLAERDWEGSELHIGDVIIRLDALRGRCHMTTIDPDTLDVNPAVLRDIVRRFDNKLALDAEVLRAGTIRVGDAVTLVRKSAASS